MIEMIELILKVLMTITAIIAIGLASIPKEKNMTTAMWALSCLIWVWV